MGDPSIIANSNSGLPATNGDSKEIHAHPLKNRPARNVRAPLSIVQTPIVLTPKLVDLILYPGAEHPIGNGCVVSQPDDNPETL